ncbi:MAG: S41 family peptidase [Rikenellaceae bacterium]
MSNISSFFARFKIHIIVISCICLGGIVGFKVSQNYTHRQFIQFLNSVTPPALQKDKLTEILSLIDEVYVDSIAIDTLSESMIPKLMKRLDPHSSYIPAKDFKRVNESLDGEFDGIGIVFNMATDTVIVLNVINNGPSAKAGLMARDRIVMINDSLVAGQKLDQDYIVSRLRGKRGTKVKLGIERSGVEGLLDVVVKRGKIPIHSIGASFIIANGVGYINMSQFARTTYREFIDASNKLMHQGMSSLIIDLRGNSGGFMDQAIAIATEFLPKGALIVYTEDRDGKREMEFSDREGQMQGLDLIILIDESSASSSEIVAGALQDNDRGTIIGRRSFGKGLVQRQIPFPDGSAIRLTSARYFTPTGRSIQKPYKMGEGDNYENEILARIEHEELYTVDSIAFADSLKFITPGGKTVYGGGGIMPDIFVPVSREKLPLFFIRVASNNILYKYTIEYSDRHRDELAAIESFEQMDAHFASDKSLVDDFLAYAKRNEYEAKESEIQEARIYIERQLKAFIARNTSLEDNGYYNYIYPMDDTLMRALDELAKIPTDSLNL